MDAMQRRPELLVYGRGGIVGAWIRIDWHIPVCAPHALEFATLGIENNHAPVSIAIRDVQLMSLLIDVNAGGTPEQARIQAIQRRFGSVADLHEEFAVAREL